MMKKLAKISKFLLILVLVIGFVFFGWPLGIQKAQAQAPTLVGVSAIGASTTGDFTITLPAHQANDILLAISWVRLSTATMATPAGWTLMTGTPFVRSTVARYYMFWKRAVSSSETNPLFDTSGTDDHYAMVAVYRGVITTGDPFEASAVSTSAVDPSVFTGVTTLTADALVVAAVGGEDNNNASIITTATDPAAFNESYLTSATGTDGAVSFSEAARTTAGATGSVSVDWVTAVPIGAGAIVLALKPAPPITTISNFVTAEPSDSTIDPGASAQVDSFGLVASAGSSDTVTGATVTLAAGTGARVATVAITNDGDTITYCSAAPSGDTATLTSCGIPVTDTNTQFKIKITAISHALMPVPPGAEYAVTATVTAFTSGNAQAGTDSASATITVDNLSPNGATAVSGTAGESNNTINWTTSNSSDFNTTSGSVVYRWAAASAGSETPDENTTPSVGSADGTATVACVISSAGSAAQSKVDGTGGSAGCTTAALTNGQAYTYKAFQKDTNGNYDVGVLIGTFTPTASTVITVDEIGTQSSPLMIPSTGNYIGGAFTMLRGTGTANVTSITITESGTVDALNNLNNIKLQYDLDTVAPYDCASVSYDAGDTQYGSTDTNGFSAANGTSAFTGSVAVSDVQAICVYVVMDVTSGAGDTQTMIVRIANPSTDVVVSAGTVEPSIAQGVGTTTLEVPKITVATEGTQANMVIGVGDNNVGGAFSFTRNTASADVTSITITDTGTVNANANISDVRVYYKQEATCSTSIPVDATLFNSSAGSFNASEKATVTGTMSVGTSKICVYVRVDAGDGAADAQTLEIEISNPSTEVTDSAGSVSPATAVAIAGTTTLNLPTYTSQGIPFLYTSANWGTDGVGVSFYLEVYMRQTTGTVYARLLNETDTTAVTGSTLSTSSTSFTRVRSVALTLTDGKTYRVQFGKIGADAGETLGAKLVVNQNLGGGGGDGADLAEYYSSEDQLDLAEVVAVDAEKVAGVKRSSLPYQKDMLGVVATQPGIILGKNVGQSYPIALVGRVPVRVTTENGQIRSGDYLTSASVPGYAMKATKAGRVLGQTLETLDLDKLRDCPSTAASAGQISCGTVMVFVNLIDYLGSPVELVMEEKQSSVLGVRVSDTDPSGDPLTGQQTTDIQVADNTQLKTDNSSRQEQILAFLKQLKEEQASASAGYRSEVFTDRVSAVNEIITPHVITDLLTAKKIKADSIEGLEIITSHISNLKTQIDNANLKTEELRVQIAGVSTSSAGLSTSEELVPNTDALGNLTIESATVSLDFNVLGTLNARGALVVVGPATFQGETAFERLVTFLSNVIFKGKVTFEEVPTFNKDTAGFAVVRKDADRVEVVFEKEYNQIPIVHAVLTFDEILTSEGKIDSVAITEQEKRIIEQGYGFIISNRSKKGFTILVNKKATEEINFSWMALAVKDAKTFQSKVEPSPTPQPTIQPTVEPSITPSQEASPSAQ